MLGRLRSLLGVDHGGDRYGYVSDELIGPVSASRAPERWVPTTCGYRPGPHYRLGRRH